MEKIPSYPRGFSITDSSGKSESLFLLIQHLGKPISIAQIIQMTKQKLIFHFFVDSFH